MVWKMFPEEAPEVDGRYLVCTTRGNVIIAKFRVCDPSIGNRRGHTSCESGYFSSAGVVAWHEIPKLPDEVYKALGEKMIGGCR